MFARREIYTYFAFSVKSLVKPLILTLWKFWANPTGPVPAPTVNDGISSGSKLGKPMALWGWPNCLTASATAVDKHWSKSSRFLLHFLKVAAKENKKSNSIKNVLLFLFGVFLKAENLENIDFSLNGWSLKISNSFQKYLRQFHGKITYGACWCNPSWWKWDTRVLYTWSLLVEEESLVN